jgi:hypothetical protein
METVREMPAEKEGARIIAEIAQGLTSYRTAGHRCTIMNHARLSERH